jgi:transcription initiation factor TFIIB
VGKNVNECVSNNVYVDEVRGEIICMDTGEVIGTLVDYGKEWRNFGESPSKKVRGGSPLNESIHDRGLSTTISRGGSSFYSKRLSRLNSRIRVQGKRRLVKTLQMLRDEAKRLNLPSDVTSTASQLIRGVIALGLGRGEMLRSYILASLYISCKIHGVPRSFSEFVKHAISYERKDLKNDIITIKKLRYAYRKILEVYREHRRSNVTLTVYKPQDYISYVSNALNLSPATTTLMYRLSRAVEKLNLIHGKSPLAMIAAITYISSGIMGEKKRQKDIAEVFGTFTDVAIRNRYRELIDNLYIEVIL